MRIGNPFKITVKGKHVKYEIYLTTFGEREDM